MSEDRKHTGALPEGTIISSSHNRYRVEKVLGSGGFGITYKVTRYPDGKVLALKEYFRKELCERDDNLTLSYLKSNKATIEEGLEDFITEAERLTKQKISHPNIVAIDEVFKANNTAYYAMEFIAGDDLLRYIKKHKDTPLTESQTLSVMRPVLKAVALLHRNRITHLDIKHENIILTQESDGSLRPVLIDFGLSKHYDKKGKATSTLTAAGCTDGFAPQEQYLGLTTFTPQADVYALGATMLYLLTAKWPVKSSEISAKKILDVLPEEISERVREAILKSLRRDKEDRTQTVDKLAEDLGIDLSDDDSDGNVTRLLHVKKRKERRPIDWRKYLRPSLWALGAAALVAGTVVLVDNLPAGSVDSEMATPVDSLAEAGQGTGADSVPTVHTEDTVKPEVAEADNKADAKTDKEPEKPVEQQQEKKPEESKPVTPPTENLDALFAAARTLQDYQALAAKGYTKAYAPLAEKYLQARQYKSADRYVRMAASSGSGTTQAKKVAETLRATGYYDDPSAGAYPF